MQRWFERSFAPLPAWPPGVYCQCTILLHPRTAFDLRSLDPIMPELNPVHPEAASPPQLARQIGLGSAVSLNMLNMIGVGPFIAMPLIIIAMGGPQAMLGWVLGALIAICDGMVWAELGAAMPRAGGSYAFLREIYGPQGAGRLFSFLYVWQVGFSAPLSIA